MLLALIILGGLVATSFTVGTAVVTRLRNTKAIDDSIIASYAAESGAEELLYAVRKTGERTNLDGTGALENGATWTRTVEATARELFLDLNQDESEQLDLLPISGASAQTDARTLLITATAPANTAWLEVTWWALLSSHTWSPAAGRVLFAPSDLVPNRPNSADLRSTPIGETPIGYRVRLRSIGGRVGALTIRVSPDDAPVGEGWRTALFPSRIRATVVGTMGSARYAMRVELPAWPSAASVFDYALFSECDIVKGGAINCPKGS